ncbi:MAG: hypothetical protein B7Z75_08165 [Acidocella sp. 20-57-95]|nr:MAG: hypothetical protein B7Z75_08165 [Acidocella sp. 20-57-95]OYV57576.1 MAG: hypothetical protein B7Z71_12225 [Acidocella sp. 21-58-7]HQT63685.1 DUF6476 family protein [Acidocella sp.]HQU05457.1 DUF6476 family protein [Acidocella sp.]
MSGQAQKHDNLRGLKALVTVLGVLIVLGTAFVIGTVIKRFYAKPVAASMTMPVSAVIPGESQVVLPPGALAPGDHIAGIAGAGGVFAVWVSGAGGDRLLLLNPQTGAVSTALGPAK